jgi:hypothetical protein
MKDTTMKMFTLFSTAFVPPINTLSNLERLVVIRAIGSTTLSTLSSEWSIDKVAFDIMNYHSNNVWIISTIIIYTYGYYKLYQITHPRLGNIPVYDKWSRVIKECLFILFLVFSRDIQNAT